jgi:drug/metabolite transporter (DMT)-like permease
MAASATLLLIRAFRETPASLLSPLLYLQLVWATLLGWLVFDHLPDLPAIVGMLIIGASGLSLAADAPAGAAVPTAGRSSRCWRC